MKSVHPELRAALEPESKHYGRCLRTLRSALGLSQAEFGAVVGVPGQVVSAWEGGRRVPTEPQAEGVLQFVGMVVGEDGLAKLRAFVDTLPPEPAQRKARLHGVAEPQPGARKL